MKKNKLKGFTLIECIVALAIIGIASLMMAQIYSSIALINKNNAKLNVTLTDQMAQAENELIEKTGDVDVLLITNYQADSTNKSFQDINDKATSVSTNQTSYKMSFNPVRGKNHGSFTTIYSSSDAKNNLDIDIVIYKSSDAALANGKDADIRYMFIRPGEYVKK